MKKMILAMTLALGITACKAHTDASLDTPPIQPAPKPETSVKPTVICDPNDVINGQMGGKEWKMKSGVAFASLGFEGMWEITLSDEVVSNPCQQFGTARGIMLRVPQALGKSDLENQKAAVFYDFNVNPQLTKTTSNGQVQIDSITENEIHGTFEAYDDETTGACGHFAITRCQ